MSIGWGNWDVRVYAADAWVSLAPRFAAEHALIVDRLEMLLGDRSPAVRIQIARNLQVISVAAPDRMWAMGKRLATQETDARVIATYLNGPMLRFAQAEPQQCEEVIAIIKQRVDAGFAREGQDGHALSQCLGNACAQLFLQGREAARGWFTFWIAQPERHEEMLSAFLMYLRPAFFFRYVVPDEPAASAMSDRAQEALSLILASMQPASHGARLVLQSEANEADKEAARRRYESAEKLLISSMDQLFFGSGATGSADGEGAGLPSNAAKARFLTDYAEALAAIGRSHEPLALHHLVQLYEFLIPASPAVVFDALHGVLLGRGNEESYQSESLANTVVVRIVQRYIADHRAIFEDAAQRFKLVEILQLFSSGGWSEALGLLYDLPDLLR